ncbi:hypothetical protein BJX70DRAFT_269235 [Aspergillus crustosus]
MVDAFVCEFPGCHASYRRKEHLTRHAARHVDGESFECSICGKQFGRSDTRRRHLRQNHNVAEPANRIRACQQCRELKTRCHGGSPCTECSRRKTSCSLSTHTSTSISISPHMEGTVIRNSTRRQTEERAINTYFDLFDPHWPFIHHGTFKRQQETRLLVQSVVAIGLWLSGESVARAAAVDLHHVLGGTILQHRDKWECLSAPTSVSPCKWPIPLFQAVILHLLFFIISEPSLSLGPDLKPVLPSKASNLLDAVVSSCRWLKMFHYPSILAQFSNDNLASYIWLGIEEIKRFNLALFKIGRRFSTPNSIQVEELQFPMPAHDELWNAVDQEEWNEALARSGGSIEEFDGPLEEVWISKSANLLRCLD